MAMLLNPKLHIHRTKRSMVQTAREALKYIGILIQVMGGLFLFFFYLIKAM